MSSLYIRLLCCAACVLASVAAAQEADSPEPAASAEVATDAADAADPATDPPPETMPTETVEPDRRSFLEDDASAQTMIEDIQQHLDLERAVGPAEPPAEGSVIDLDVRRCVDIALERNAQLLQADEELRRAQAQIGVARSGFLPNITGRYGITQTEYHERKQSGGLMSLLGGGASSMGGGFSAGGITGDPLVDIPISMLIGLGAQTVQQALTPDLTPDDRLYSTEVTVRQVVYTGGQLTAALRASEYLAESQEWQREAVAAELEYLAKQAFYDALLTNALIRVAEESVRTFERSLSDAQDMFDVGMISQFEVLRAQTELGLREADYVKAMNMRELALAGLRRILYLPQDTPVRLTSTFEWQPPTTRVEDHVVYALEHRPEVRALEQAVLASRQDVRRVKGQYLPQVAATATYQNVDGAGPASPDGWTFTLGAEWEIAAGGRRRHERIAADAQAKSLEHQLTDIERQVELDVTQAWIGIQDAMAQIESERGNVDLAKEGLRLAELRFQEGVGTQSEVLDAELALTAAETNLIQALREYAVANAALERATGANWRAGDPEQAAVPAQPEPELDVQPEPGAESAAESAAEPAGEQ